MMSEYTPECSGCGAKGDDGSCLLEICGDCDGELDQLREQTRVRRYPESPSEGSLFDVWLKRPAADGGTNWERVVMDCDGFFVTIDGHCISLADSRAGGWLPMPPAPEGGE